MAARIEYDRDAVYKWLVVLKFEDLGLDPLVAMNLVEGTWEHHIRKIVARANKSKADVFMSVYYPVLLAAWHTPVIPVVSHCTANEAGRLMKWLSDDRHAVIFNLSACLRILNAELKAA